MSVIEATKLLLPKHFKCEPKDWQSDLETTVYHIAELGQYPARIKFFDQEEFFTTLKTLHRCLIDAAEYAAKETGDPDTKKAAVFNYMLVESDHNYYKSDPAEAIQNVARHIHAVIDERGVRQENWEWVCKQLGTVDKWLRLYFYPHPAVDVDD